MRAFSCRDEWPPESAVQAPRKEPASSRAINAAWRAWPHGVARAWLHGRMAWRAWPHAVVGAHE